MTQLPEVFTVRQGADSGITPGRLRRIAAPYYGVRATAPIDLADLRDRCRFYAPRLTPGQFFSHATALALIGVPVPWPTAVHVSQHRPAREPRTAGVVGHRLQVRDAAYVLTDDGLPIEDPIRAWRQSAWHLGIDHLIIAGDHLVSPPQGLATLDDLRSEVGLMGDYKFRLKTALLDIRVGSESPRETRVRLVICRAGLPEPELGYELFDNRGTFVARFDQAYPRYRVAVEYDGRQHAFDVHQFERDADRWDAIRAQGWTLVRILNHHLRGDGSTVVSKVSAALRDAGWHPGLSAH